MDAAGVHVAAVTPPQEEEVIHLANLPLASRKALAKFDTDGSGTVTTAEIQAHARKASVMRKRLIMAIVALVVTLAITIGCIVGATYAIVQTAKAIDVAKGNLLVSKSGVTVATANSEFMLGPDGSIVLRATPTPSGARSLAATGGDVPDTVSVGTAQKTAPISSDLPDEAFAHLQSMVLKSPTGSVMHLNVLGFIREPSFLGINGPITILTHIGRVILSGTELSYIDDTQAQLFAIHGFPVSVAASGNGARSLQLLELFGIFNAVVKARQLALASLAPPNASDVFSSEPANPLPPSLPDNFIMTTTVRYNCIPIPPNSSSSPTDFDGLLDGSSPIEIDAGTDFCALLSVPESELVNTYWADTGDLAARYMIMDVVIYRHGSTRLRIEYSQPAFPGKTVVELLDNSDPEHPVSIRYQTDDANRGMALDAKGDLRLVGPVYYVHDINITKFDIELGASNNTVEFLGYTTIDLEPVRIWAITVNNGQLPAFWYQSESEDVVRRIDIPAFYTMDVTSVETISEFNAREFAAWYAAPVDGQTIIAGTNLTAEAYGNLPLPMKMSKDPVSNYQRSLRSRLKASGRRRRILKQIPTRSFDAPPASSRALVSLPRQLAIGKCQGTNFCPNNIGTTQFALWFYVGSLTIAPFPAPADHPSCYYALMLQGDLPALPGFALGGGFTLELCKDGNGVNQFSGEISLFWSVLPAAIKNLLPKKAAEAISVRLIGIRMGQYSTAVSDAGAYFYPDCKIVNGKLIGDSGNPTLDSYSVALLENLVTLQGAAMAATTCACFNSGEAFVQVGANILLPNLGGGVLGAIVLVVAPAPANIILAAIAATIIRIDNDLMLLFTQRECGDLNRFDAKFSMTLVIDLFFASWSFPIWSPQSTRYSYKKSKVGKYSWTNSKELQGRELLDDVVDRFLQAGSPSGELQGPPGDSQGTADATGSGAKSGKKLKDEAEDREREAKKAARQEARAERKEDRQQARCARNPRKCRRRLLVGPVADAPDFDSEHETLLGHLRDSQPHYSSHEHFRSLNLLVPGPSEFPRYARPARILRGERN